MILPTPRLGSRESNIWFGSRPGLTGNEQDCDYGVGVAMLIFEVVQPVSQKVKNQEKITGDQNGINRQLNGKSSKSFRSFFFHAAEPGESRHL